MLSLLFLKKNNLLSYCLDYFQECLLPRVCNPLINSCDQEIARGIIILCLSICVSCLHCSLFLWCLLSFCCPGGFFDLCIKLNKRLFFFVISACVLTPEFGSLTCKSWHEYIQRLALDHSSHLILLKIYIFSKMLWYFFKESRIYVKCS